MTRRSPLRPLHTTEELRQALAQSDDEGQKTRIRAIINIQEGAHHLIVATRFVINKNTLTYWVKLYNEGGIPALKVSKGGHPKGNQKWDQAIFDDLVQEIDKGGQYWSIPLMQEWLKKNKGQEIPESTVWYHLDRLDYSHKSARPHPYKGDRERQETFKKGGL